MRTAGASVRRGAGPESGGRGRDSGRGPGAHGLRRPPAPLLARTHPHRGPAAGPASTPRGDHYITPRPAAPSPAVEGGPERSPGGRALPAPGGRGWGAPAAARIYFFSAGDAGGGGARGASSGGRLRRPSERGLLGGVGAGGAARPGPLGPASSAPGARCEAAAPAWLWAPASCARPLGGRCGGGRRVRRVGAQVREGAPGGGECLSSPPPLPPFRPRLLVAMRRRRTAPRRKRLMAAAELRATSAGPAPAAAGRGPRL